MRITASQIKGTILLQVYIYSCIGKNNFNNNNKNKCITFFFNLDYLQLYTNWIGNTHIFLFFKWKRIILYDQTRNKNKSKWQHYKHYSAFAILFFGKSQIIMEHI